MSARSLWIALAVLVVIAGAALWASALRREAGATPVDPAREAWAAVADATAQRQDRQDRANAELVESAVAGLGVECLANTLDATLRQGVTAAPALGDGASRAPVVEWDAAGVPLELESSRDVYSDAFLEQVVDALPESYPGGLPALRPELFSGVASSGVLRFSEDAEALISFVHEGAGYRNVAGVFTFPTATPPTDPGQLELQTVFPNASAAGSGGGLELGDSLYLGTIAAGTSLGFYLLPDGYRGETLESPYDPIYSIPQLNDAPAAQQQHSVILSDPDDDRFVIAFEDIRRDRGGDQDFNDLILTVRVSELTALEGAACLPTLDDTAND